MGTRVDRALLFLMSVITAAITALALALIAHYDFGLSREEIRGAAMVGAGVIAALGAIEFFGEKLGKPKCSGRARGAFVWRGRGNVACGDCRRSNVSPIVQEPAQD